MKTGNFNNYIYLSLVASITLLALGAWTLTSSAQHYSEIDYSVEVTAGPTTVYRGVVKSLEVVRYAHDPTYMSVTWTAADGSVFNTKQNGILTIKLKATP